MAHRGSLLIRAACAALILPFVGAREAASSGAPSPPPTRQTPAVASPAARNLLMGTGEPRIPQPFTLEQRLLEAVRRDDRKTIEHALERGATVHAKDDIGRSTVLLAVLDAGDLDLVRWLHSKGALLDEPDAGGRTALSFAAERGRLDIARYLIENGAAVDRADVQERTPLLQAVLGDHREVAAFLIERGANVNARDQFGDTPLIVACAKGYAEMAALLLQRGADPILKDQEGRTARDRAAPGTKACETLGVEK